MPRICRIYDRVDEEPTKIQGRMPLDSDKLLWAIKTRRTIRRFKKEAVPQEIIEHIIEAGRLTPSGKNSANVSYIVLNEKKDVCEKAALGFLRKLQPINSFFNRSEKNAVVDNNFFFKGAPLVIMVMSKNKVNGTLAASNMALMAEAFGLGVLFSGYFTFAANYSRKLRKELKLVSGEKSVVTLVLGYPNVVYQRTPQRELANIKYM